MLRALVLLASLLAFGCGTMVNGRHQTLSVDSYPSGAAIEVDCGEGTKVAAATPAKVTVLRAAEYCQLTFTRSGYEPKVIELTHQQSRATTLNTAFGVSSAIVLGIAGAVAGSLLDDPIGGAELGLEAGFDLGRKGATALDKKGGGYKWVPGNVFVILSRTPREEPADPDVGSAPNRD